MGPAMTALSKLIDYFTNFQITSPGAYAYTVTPNDSTILSPPARGVYVGTTGNLAVVLQADEEGASPVTFINVQGGTLLPIKAIKVMSTNTTADNIVAVA